MTAEILDFLFRLEHRGEGISERVALLRRVLDEVVLLDNLDDLSSLHRSDGVTLGSVYGGSKPVRAKSGQSKPGEARPACQSPLTIQVP